MEVEYELSPDDLYAFQWRAAYTSPMIKRARRNMYLGLFLAVFLLSVLPAIGPDGFVISRISFGFLVISSAVVGSLAWFIEKRMTRRTIREFLKQERQDKGQLGKHRMVLDDAGLVETTAVGESRTSWPGVHRVEQNADYFFIYVAPAMAHVIPRRSFRDPQEADRFFEHATAKTQAAPAHP